MAYIFSASNIDCHMAYHDMEKVMLSLFETILNRFGHKIVPMDAVVIIVDCPRMDADLAMEISRVVIEHHERPIADNVIEVRF